MSPVQETRRLVDQEQDFPRALELLRSVTELTGECQYLMGFCLSRTGAATDTVLEHYQSALELGFEPYWVHLNRHLVYEAAGQQAESAAELARALALNPGILPLREKFCRWALGRLAEQLPADCSAALQQLDNWLRSGISPQAAAPATMDPSVLSALEARLEDRLRDLMVTLRPDGRSWTKPFVIRTDWPVAWESDDHRVPWGTAQDNTRHVRFVAACERLLGGRQLAALDLGCAGGGLVLDFLLRGHRAMGLEGSDHSARSRRAEWRLIGSHLATCDIGRPFAILDGRGPARFDVISAWEVLEHIPEDRLPDLLANIRGHLASDGLFVASVSTIPDEDPARGAVYHVTVRPRDWWQEQLERAGLVVRSSPFDVQDYVRGSGNGWMDWDVRTRPDIGFHLVASLPHAAPFPTRSGRRIPVKRLPDGAPALQGVAGTRTKEQVAVISVPKAGTYLVGRLLSELGLVDTEVHAGPHSFSDYRDRPLEQRRRDYLNFDVDAPLGEVARLVGPGQFLVGHLPNDSEVRRVLDRFRRLLLVRDLRHAFVSHMRFIGGTGRGGPVADGWRDMPDGPAKMLAYMDQYSAGYFGMCVGVAGWLTDEATLPVRFETLMGDDGEDPAQALVGRIARAVGIGAEPCWAELRRRVIGVETLTWSGRRTELSLVWDAHVEARFAAVGGPELNHRFGYARAWSPESRAVPEATTPPLTL